MELTIARDRWQSHLKTRGQYYHELGSQLEQLATSAPQVGAGVASLAAHALAELLERARVQRLTRSQHVLFELGRLIAQVEGAGALARRAALAATGTSHDKTEQRFDAGALAAMSRVSAREAGLHVALEGIRIAVGADGVPEAERGAFEQSLRLGPIQHAQAGLLEDMDRVANALYGR
jgi:alkylation response protein AidB-like acyl-CoA dehydrogenase